MKFQIFSLFVVSILSGVSCVSGPTVPPPPRVVTPAKQELTYETDKIAADLGSVKSQLGTAQALLAGKGVKKDTALAVEYFKKAADAGNAEAQARLGVIYLQGEIVPKDKTKAFELISKSVEQKHPLGHYAMGEYYAAERPVDYKKEFEWMQKGAELGSLSAQHRLATMYRKGEGVTKNRFRAMEWIKKAAEAGHASAQYELGFFYRNGQTVGRDSKKAMAWFQACALQELARCVVNIAEMYKTGDFGEENRQKVGDLYRQAIEIFEADALDGKSYAFFELGNAYREGRGVPKNAFTASAMYKIGLKVSRLHYPVHAKKIEDLRKDLTETQQKEVDELSRSWTEGSALPSHK